MSNEQYRTVDKFDRMMGALANLPDVTHTQPSTIVAGNPLIGATQTFILQTFRQREIGDTMFLLSDRPTELAMLGDVLQAMFLVGYEQGWTDAREAPRGGEE